MDNKRILGYEPIFVLGYMASGKTTFGRALARALNRQFIDLDFYIEQRYRTTINRIFSESGEAAFRDMESRMLREVGDFENVVIACGGGTPCFNNNMDYMTERGLTVFLETSVERIMERLKANSSRRPLMAGKSETDMRQAVIDGIATRMPHYGRAKISFCGEKLESRSQIADSVNTFIAAHLKPQEG